LVYAERRGFKLAVIAGSSEFEKGTWNIKSLAKREEIAVADSDLVEKVRGLLGLVK
jgi:histidyl-tRNA synthetase